MHALDEQKRAVLFRAALAFDVDSQGRLQEDLELAATDAVAAEEFYRVKFRLSWGRSG